MAEISKSDQESISRLRSVAPHLADIATKMAVKKGESRALDAAGDKFKELAAVPDTSKINPVTSPLEYANAQAAEIRMGFTLRSINTQLNNPQTKANVEALLQRNPAGFESVLPQIFKDPAATSRLIGEQLAATSAAPAAKQAEKPKIDPVSVAAAPAAKPAEPAGPRPEAPAASGGRAPAAPEAKHPASPASAPAATAAEAPAPATDGMTQFMEILGRQEQKTPGIISDFSKFKTKMDANQVPAVSDAYRALLKSDGSPEDQAKAMTALERQIQSNPKIFADINKTLDEKPGQAATLVSTISGAGSAKGGFGALAAYSALSNSAFGQSQFGKMLIGLIDGLFKPGGLGQMFSGFLGTMKGQFASSSATEQIVQSNNNGRQTQDLNAKAGVQPQTVRLQNQNGDKQEMTGAQFASRGTTAPAAATPEQQRLQQTAANPSSPG